MDVDYNTTETTLSYEYSQFGSVVVTYRYTDDELEIEWGDGSEYLWLDVYIGTIEEFVAGFEQMIREAEQLQLHMEDEERMFSENNTDEDI